MNKQKSWEHIHLNMPKLLVEKIDSLIKRGKYLSRTAAINDAVARLPEEAPEK